MKYLVMETHPAYAVLLDQSGRFLKAANLNYHVGDTVMDIIELSPSPDSGQKRIRLLRRMTGSLTAVLRRIQAKLHAIRNSKASD